AAGQVVRVTVKENELVKKGQVIAEIDDADYAARVQQAEAELQTAEAQAASADAQAQVVEATSKGGLASARAGVSGSSVGVANADLAHARVKSAQAMLRLAQLQLSYTKVTVPADGLASKLTVHEGQLVQIGQPVIQLVPTATYVIANF